MSIDSAGLHISDFVFFWYGILIVIGVAAGAECASWLAQRNGHNPEHVWRSLVPTSILGLIGARLWFILFPPLSVTAIGETGGWFLSHFFDLNRGVFAVWAGGLGLFGGLIGGAAGIALYARAERLPLLPWLDIAAFGLALGQTIGRFGNGANQELYGPPTTLPWGVLISDPMQRVGPYTDLNRYPLATTLFQPVFFYEALLAAAIFGVMLYLLLRHRQRLLTGDLAFIYIALYGIGRALLEGLRANPSLVSGINISQAVAGIAGIIAVLLLVRRHRAKKTTVEIAS